MWKYLEQNMKADVNILVPVMYIDINTRPLETVALQPSLIWLMFDYVSWLAALGVSLF